MIAHFVLAGQSNLDQWFHAGDGVALEAFKATFLELNPQYTDVQFFDAARGGSALLSGSALEYAAVRAPDDAALYERISENYWYDETTGTAGPNLTMFLEDIEAAVAAGTEFLGVIWAQGEADTTYVGANGAGDYTEGLAYVLEQLALASDAPHTYIQALGDRSFYSERLHAGATAIREAQQFVADSSDAITLSTTIFDLDLRDSVHLTDEAYEIAAMRMAVAISTGETSPGVGEAILVDARTLLVQLELSPDQVFTGEVGAGGFTLLDGGVEIDIDAITMSAEGLLRVTTLSDLSEPILAYGSVEQSVDMQPADFINVSGPNGPVPILPFHLDVSPPRLETTEIEGGLRIESRHLSETIVGMSGDDYLFGHDGHDVLIGGWGTDRLYGGEGADTFVLATDSSTDVVYDFNLAEDAIGLVGYAQDEVTFRPYGDNDLDIRTTGGQRIVLRDVAFTSAEDVLFHMLGSDASNDLTGSAGDDRIFAFGGDDRVDSGAGYDRITLGAGADTVVFGTGYDTNIVYDFDVAQDTISLVGVYASSLTVSQYGQDDLELRTHSGDRLILRNISILDTDSINFEDDRPEVAFLTGTDGNDVLRGSAISDLIDGQGGTDRLYGGGGNDVFVFGEGSDLNVIYDFVDGQDKILVNGGNMDELILLAYKTTDAEIRLDTGERMVIRNLDYTTLDTDDFVFSLPAEFIW